MTRVGALIASALLSTAAPVTPMQARTVVPVPQHTSRCPFCYAHLSEDMTHMDSGMTSCGWPGWAT